MRLNFKRQSSECALLNRLTDVAIRFIDAFNAGELPLNECEEITNFARNNLQWHVARMKADNEFEKIAKEEKIADTEFTSKKDMFLKKNSAENIRKYILEGWSKLKDDYELFGKYPQFFVKMMKVSSQLLVIRK